MSMTKCQEAALNTFRAFLLNPDQREMVLSGSPGRGKSWLTQRLIMEAESISNTMNILGGDSYNFTFAATATTGKAATVLGNMLDSNEACTTHSFLGIRPKFNFRTKKTNLIKTSNYVVQESCLLIIDEASTIDPTFLELIRGATSKCKTLFIGDKRQLAPVGYDSCVVFDDPEVFAELKEPVRFDKDSGIAEIGAQLEKTIDTGVFKPIVANADVEYINGDEFQRLISAYYSYDNIRNDDVKIVCWSNNQVRDYNNYVRSLFDKPEEFQIGERVISAKAVIPRGCKAPVVGTEQLLTISNVSEPTLYQGIKGRWYGVRQAQQLLFQPDDQRAAQYVVDKMFKQDAFTAYTLKEELADLRPPYATTAYKAQGSTYKYVFVDLDDIGLCHNWSTVARMLNVAITRAKEKVFLYGTLPDKYKDYQHELN